MSRTKLLLDVVDDMRSLADSLQAVAEALMRNDPEPETAPEEEKPAPPSRQSRWKSSGRGWVKSVARDTPQRSTT